MHFLKTLCSQVCVRETSKYKLRLKKKKSKRERRSRVSGRGGGGKEDKKEHLPVQITSSIPGASDSKEPTCDAVDPGLIPG